MKYDFSGWATKNNLQCSDGKVIIKNAFMHNDGQTVPLVWNHQHNDPLNVLGHAQLENRDEGVYAYCSFNDTEAGKDAKLLVEHGDVSALSIYANQLKQQGANVIHGAIREVSLVLAGANPGAFIDTIMQHGEESDDAAIIYTGEGLSLEHTDTKTKGDTMNTEEKPKEDTGDNETVADVFATLTDKQKTVVYAMVGQALDDSSNTNSSTEDSELSQSEIQNDDKTEGGIDTMKHNVFDKEGSEKAEVLSHSDMEAIIADGKRCGSLKDAFDDAILAHGITGIDSLFPDAQNFNNAPGFITKDQSWVTNVMSKVHHTPFSRVKSIFANLTADDARAKGYVKGKQKLDEVFSLLKRSTTPTTVYKHQKLDRDDVVDITDFDVVAWLKSEMRLMLDEELARAFLIGDGRLVSSDEHINEGNIRPIWKDNELYTIKKIVEITATTTADAKAKAFIRAAVKSRKDYKGSGNPTLYTTEDTLTDCLLMEDTQGRVIYDSVDKLAIALRVSGIVTVPQMEGQTRIDTDTKPLTLMGIIVNLADYNVGADKGGAVNMFDDFDIDYNAQKYLIETRCSGALVVPYSAIAIESKVVTA